jgi:hypothetical protein
VSILGASGPTADGEARLRPEQRGTVERLNGLTSNLRVPTRTKPRLPPTKPENRGLVGSAAHNLAAPEWTFLSLATIVLACFKSSPLWASSSRTRFCSARGGAEQSPCSARTTRPCQPFGGAQSGTHTPCMRHLPFANASVLVAKTNRKLPHFSRFLRMPWHAFALTLWLKPF